MKAAVFPGQGAQFVGMGKDLFERSALARTYFEQANEILGFDITAVMFEGDEQALKRTEVTQPAIFIHSVIAAKLQGEQFKPDMVAGHSLGEFSALVAAGVLSFEDGLSLVAKRANAMQEACGLQRGTMAAVLGLDDAIVEQTCQEIEGIVVAANYNCPGQLVISGDYDAVEKACEVLKERGAKRALLLPVGGAFHSPLMAPAKKALAAAIEQTDFKAPLCPIYQNVSAQAVSDPTQIKQQLIEQLTAPVRWTQSIEQMIADGATEFTEYGPGKVLQGLIKKIDRNAEVAGA
ncbi:MAG: ACP S-malonyltransferase [Bacteroidetes bacterium]|nr:ACP S-malonyltransferase [Bacteroidota bacterium]